LEELPLFNDSSVFLNWQNLSMVTWQTPLTSLLTLDIRLDKPDVLILVTAMVAQFSLNCLCSIIFSVVR